MLESHVLRGSSAISKQISNPLFVLSRFGFYILPRVGMKKQKMEKQFLIFLIPAEIQPSVWEARKFL
jgi:hypothetical protein